MGDLPTIVCLKSANNNKYLMYKHDDAYTHGLLQFAGDDIKDTYAQFQVEKSKKWPDLVHFKSRYNNKYLVRWSPFHYWISATANAPDEDQTRWSCTLFRAFVAEDSPNNIRLVHVQLGHYVRLYEPRPVGDPFYSCLFAESSQADGENKLDVLTAIDWESLFTLPKRVAFMGDNGDYLGAVTFNGEPGLAFAFKDVKDPKVAHEIIQSPDGIIYLKSEHYGKFWRVADDDWVVVDEKDPEATKTRGSMFRLIAIDINVIALVNMNPCLIIKRFTVPGRESSLATKTTTIDVHARLRLVNLDNETK